MYTITRAKECRDLNESKSVKKLCGLCYCYIAESIFIYFYGFFTQSVSQSLSFQKKGFQFSFIAKQNTTI